MAASYPGTVKTYTDKVDGVSLVAAADINSVQAEVSAIETALGTSPTSTILQTGGVTYSGPSSFSSVSSRIANLEAGISAGSTDASRIGYTLLASGNFTSAPGAISVTGTSYVKFVVVINVTTQNASPSTLNMTVNGVTTGYTYGHINYGVSAMSFGAGSQSASAWPISNAATLLTGDAITAEIYNVANGGTKAASWTNKTGIGNGILSTTAITSVTLTTANYPVAATYAVYGVK
jgi:hypothetical protein